MKSRATNDNDTRECEYPAMKPPLPVSFRVLKSTGSIVLAVLCVTVVLAAGCTGTTSTAPAVTGSTGMSLGSSGAKPLLDPVVGVWKSPGTVYRFQITFEIDGRTQEYYSSVPNVVFNGTWQSLGDNKYMVTRDNGKTSVWTYDPSSNTITKNDAPEIVYSLYQGVSTTTRSETGGSAVLFSGNGDKIVPFTATASGLWIFSLQYSGEGNFIVWLKDEHGNRLAVLANEIGVYTGIKPQNVDAGKYFLNVTASGPWTIKASVS